MYKGLTLQEVADRTGDLRRLLLLVCLLVALPAWGAGGVLVVGDTSRSYFRSFASSLAAGLDGSGIELSVADTERSRDLPLSGGAYRCIVTVGSDAARELSEKSPVPLLHALVTESFSQDLYSSSNGKAVHSFLLIDQPVSRLVRLAKSSMPERRNLGVIYGPYSRRYQGEVRRAAEGVGIALVEREISEPSQLGEMMSVLKGNVDALLTLPDATVVNEGTAKTLILGAYLHNLPLIGYSQALVKAGALMAVHSTPEQLGVQAAELVRAPFWKDPGLKGQLIYPQHYQISVNYQVARALQIELPSESVLKRQLEQMEGAR